MKTKAERQEASRRAAEMLPCSAQGCLAAARENGLCWDHGAMAERLEMELRCVPATVAERLEKLERLVFDAVLKGQIDGEL
jgi:hypothetical protein